MSKQDEKKPEKPPRAIVTPHNATVTGTPAPPEEIPEKHAIQPGNRPTLH